MNDVRAVAAQLLAKLLKQQGSLATVLPEFSQKVPTNDKALLQELCYGTCRWQPRLQCFIETLLEKPLRAKDTDIHALLLLGLYQLIFMRIPDHAVLDMTVSAAQRLKKPWAKKLINGVLRRFLREREELEQKLQTNPVFEFAHPNWLQKKIQSAWPNDWQAILQNSNASPPMTLRVNQHKVSRPDYLQTLKQHSIDATPTSFSGDGVQLAQAMPVDQLPGFSEGLVSVQDEAAQLSASLLLDNHYESALTILDACSAPGGKTAHLLETNSDLDVLALDISERRLQKTRENLQRLGLQARCQEGDASQPTTWWDGNNVDRILIDAPCSATGIIRRQPDIKILRNDENLTKLINTQCDILDALWPLLKPGGVLLYATCSILPEENTLQVEQFLRRHHDANEILINADFGIEQTVGRQLLPQQTGHDGFYFARIQKAN